MRSTLPYAAFAVPTLFLLAAPGSGQISFSREADVPTGHNTRGLELADFDGDGVEDIVVVSGGPASGQFLEFHRGDGAGGFSLAGAVLLAGFTEAIDLVAGEFDTSPGVDLAVLSNFPNSVTLASNQGGFAFAFGPMVAIPGLGPGFLEPADLNGDGWLDLIASDFDTAGVSVLFNQQGNFVSLGPYAVGPGPRHVAAADFNADGAMDLAVACESDSTFRFLAGSGSGGFAEVQSVTVPAGSSAYGAAFVDLDGDGDEDFVGTVRFSAPNSFDAALMYDNEAGVFQPPGATLGAGKLATDAAPADFDLDGDVDIAVGATETGQIGIVYNFEGSFVSLTGLLFLAPPSAELIARDLNGDGTADLLALRSDGPGIAVFLNDASVSGPIGVNYCDAVPNATGLPAIVAASGSDVVADNALSLACTSLPPNALGYFLVAGSWSTPIQPFGSIGNLCLGGSIGRYSDLVLNAGVSGSFARTIDLTWIPMPNGFVSASVGESYFFQAWFRDSAGGPSTSNFSDAVRVDLK